MSSSPERVVKMARVAPAPTSTSEDDPALTAIAREVHSIWPLNLDHPGFVKRVVELLAPQHTKVLSAPEGDPGYDEIYSEVHKPTCRWETVCECISTVTVEDSGGAVKLTIVTAMAEA